MKREAELWIVCSLIFCSCLHPHHGLPRHSSAHQNKDRRRRGCQPICLIKMHTISKGLGWDHNALHYTRRQMFATAIAVAKQQQQRTLASVRSKCKDVQISRLIQVCVLQRHNRIRHIGCRQHSIVQHSQYFSSCLPCFYSVIQNTIVVFPWQRLHRLRCFRKICTFIWRAQSLINASSDALQNCPA